MCHSIRPICIFSFNIHKVLFILIINILFNIHNSSFNRIFVLCKLIVFSSKVLLIKLVQTWLLDLNTLWLIDVHYMCTIPRHKVGITFNLFSYFHFELLIIDNNNNVCVKCLYSINCCLLFDFTCWTKTINKHSRTIHSREYWIYVFLANVLLVVFLLIELVVIVKLFNIIFQLKMTRSS